MTQLSDESMKVIDRHKFSEIRMREDAQLLIGKRMEWSQDGERFTLDDYKRGIGISYSTHDLKCFRKGVYHENARLLEAIQSLLELVDKQDKTLKYVLASEPTGRDGTYCPINQPSFVAAEKTIAFKTEVLKGLANG